MKIALIVLVVAIGLGLTVEIILRLLFGFGNPPLYVADQQVGYRLAPNQKVRRFGNRIEINRYSMRSAEVAPIRPETTLRILLLGDSIANGGWWTDQGSTISAMIQHQLQLVLLETNFKQVEVLNASANSWGPRNELAYLKQFGHFDAQVILLLINTDDLFSPAPTSVQVGRDANYPDHKPAFAIAEVISRYLLKQSPIPELEAVMAEKGDRVGFNLEAIGQIRAIAQQHQATFLLAMTPLLREIGTPGPRDYELKARQRLSDFAQTQHILYIDFLPIFNATPNPETLYRDHIHLSPKGNQLVSETISNQLS